MSYVTETLSNLIHQTAFFNLTWGNYLMIAVACVFLYLAIKKGFEPLLLVPIAFGMLLVNIYPDIMANPEDMSNGVGGLLHYFYILDEWSILPSLIFMGVGAMTDFGPLIANPVSLLLGAAAQFGPLEQDAHGGRESGVRNLLLRLPGDSRLGHSDTHVHARHAAEQFVEVLQFGRTARQHDAVGQFPGVSRILDLLLHELRDVRGAGLDHRGQVAQQNVLRLAGRTAVDADQLVLGSQFLSLIHI